MAFATVEQSNRDSRSRRIVVAVAAAFPLSMRRSYMRIIVFIFSALCILSGLSVPKASAQDGYDIDCAVILCMAGGWPVETSGTCNAAEARSFSARASLANSIWSRKSPNL